jgi:membrane protease YdiL (CAAX protease family)
MKTIVSLINPGPLCPSEQIKPSVILLLAAFLPTVHKYFGSMEFAYQYLGYLDSSIVSLYMFITAFILMGIFPCLIIRYYFHEPLSEYGWQWGNWKAGLSAVVILFPTIALGMLLPSSQTSEMQNFYPFNKLAANSASQFLVFQCWRGIFFYTAWEFFFRGFILFGLRRYVGDWLAICIQTIPSCLWHIGMPSGEIFASIAGGVLFGILAIRTSSIVWPFLLHYLIGVGLDFFIVITS